MMSQLAKLVLDHLTDVLLVTIREDENFCRELNIAMAAVCTVDAHRMGGDKLGDDEVAQIFHEAVERLSEIHSP